LRDLHRTKVRAAHRAEVRELSSFLRQRLVVVFARKLRIERKVELVFPSELEAGFRKRVVLKLSARMSLGKVGSVSCDLVSYHSVLHVLLVRQAQVLLGGDVAKHGGSKPADHCCADRACYVIVARRDIGYERTKSIERSFAANFKLPVDVLLDQVHRDVSGAFDHHLAVHIPGGLCQLTERVQLSK